jgi:predicted MFS family arabinose efflux permease
VPARWGTVAAYAATAGANQLLWLTYAPITTDSARHFGVSEGTIGWLSQVFPALYVVLALPAGLALDRAFRPALLTGAWLTVLGGVTRLTADTFAAALAGQILVAIAQPLMLNAVTKVAVAALPVTQRPNGIALGSAGIFAGTALALPLAPALADADSLTPLLLVDLALAAAAALWLTAAMRGVAPAVPAVFAGRGELRAVWGDRGVRRLCAVAFLGFGVFVALTTWLQALLEPAGISDTTAGWYLGTMVLAGVVASALLPPPLVRARRERAFLRVAALVAAGGGVTRAIAPHAAIVAVIPLGIVLLGALPVILELTERRAGQASGAATALVWLAGNAGGIVVAVLVQAVNDHPTAGFSLLAAVAALVLAFA